MIMNINNNPVVVRLEEVRYRDDGRLHVGFRHKPIYENGEKVVGHGYIYEVYLDKQQLKELASHLLSYKVVSHDIVKALINDIKAA
jgi:hypothetical protein